MSIPGCYCVRCREGRVHEGAIIPPPVAPPILSESDPRIVIDPKPLTEGTKHDGDKIRTDRGGGVMDYYEERNLKTDEELCADARVLEPEYTRAHAFSEKLLKEFEAEHFKPIIKKLTDAVGEALWDMVRDRRQAGRLQQDRRSTQAGVHGTQGTSMRIDLSPKIKDDSGYGEHF